MKVWINGTVRDGAGAIDAADRGVLLGDGLFETLAVMGGQALRLDRHLARLANGAAFLGMTVPASRAEIDAAIRALAADAGGGSGAARITLLRGPGPRGVLPPETPMPTLMISVGAAAVGATDPVRAIVATSTRRNERSPLSGLKTTNYLDAIVAKREAAAVGADEAILLNTQGGVAEATAANVFCVVGGDLVTPPVADGALPGIMRDRIMETEDVIERTLTADDLTRATEIILSSSLSVRAVTSLDGRPVGGGAPGPVAQRLGELPKKTF